MPRPHQAPATGIPSRVVLGVGASRGCPPAELVALADAALSEAGLRRPAVRAVASADVKADEPAILALAATLGVPVRFLPAGLLATVTVPTPSAVVAAHVGTPSVAEAAAILVAGEAGGDVPADAAGRAHPADRDGPATPAGAGARGRLLVTKRRSAHATCAVAADPSPAPAPRRVVTATEECRGCGGCLRTCPEHALVPVGAVRPDGSFAPGRDGVPLLTLVERCTGCGECLEICPVDAFTEVTLP